jgi:hypothetical protein
MGFLVQPVRTIKPPRLRPARPCEHLAQVCLDRLVEPARHVLGDISRRDPGNGVQLARVHYVCRPGEHVAGNVGQVRCGVRVDLLSENLQRTDSEAGLLKDLAHRGLDGALARLGLAAGQHPRRSAVVHTAAHQKQVAMLDDHRDSRGQVRAGIGHISMFPF